MKKQRRTQEEMVTERVQIDSENGSIYDDTFRTIQQKMPWLLIPIINETFGTKYPMDTEVRRLPTEYENPTKKLIADSCNKIGDRTYHLEVQSYKDGTMVLRMVEYDFVLGLLDVREIKGEFYICMPKSCVIYLRSDGKTPNYEQANLIFQDGQKVKYRVPAVKIQDYSLDEIFEKKLYAYLPYYLMRYEKKFESWEKSEAKIKALQEECDQVLTRLAEALADKPTEFQDILHMMQDIANHIMRKQDKLRERVSDVMGGKVLPLPSDKLREAEAIGEARGEARGEQKGDAKRSIKFILEVLEDYGEVPPELREKICATEDIHALEAMFTLARKAESIEDFQAKLEEMKCCM